MKLTLFVCLLTCVYANLSLYGDVLVAEDTDLKDRTSVIDGIPEENVKETWTFSFYFENDLFANTDANYTNGTKFSWISPDLTDYRNSDILPEWLYNLTGYLPFINEPGLQRNIAISIGQNMYTPSDISRTDLIEDDRPYAGWLYMGIAFHNKNEHFMDTMEVNFGVVGPWSFAEETQDFVHKVRGIPRPQGWDNGLENEPALNFIWERKYKFLKYEWMGGLGMDSVVHVGASLGNVYTYANTGASIRVGWHLPSDFGASTIRMAGDTNAPSSRLDPRFSDLSPWGFHFFVGVDGRAIARDIFLDGNTFRDSHSVDKKPFVGDLSIGASLLIYNWKLSYAQVIRTRQFEEQERGHHNFGSINISFSY